MAHWVPAVLVMEMLPMPLPPSAGREAVLAVTLGSLPWSCGAVWKQGLRLCGVEALVLLYASLMV